MHTPYYFSIKRSYTSSGGFYPHSTEFIVYRSLMDLACLDNVKFLNNLISINMIKITV